jgi:Nif-specific regulatory protein
MRLYDKYLLNRLEDFSTLLVGETGTGKGVAAAAIGRSGYIPFDEKKECFTESFVRSFVAINLSQFPESLIESELFGHRKGAFTGALDSHIGVFSLCSPYGAIFLDEIGDLSPTTQIKLLRVLQEREFERVGGNETIRCNVRVIAATNRNLEQLMEKGTFREDLYYRLNVFPIHIPPLRERKSDIILLVDHFIEKYATLNHKKIQRISTPAIDLLMAYHWPGNVRELENCIERAVLLSTDEVIHSNHLPPSLQSAESTNTRLHTTLKEAMDNLERELILDALKSTKGNMAKAAKLLGITERIMGLRVQKHRIDPRVYRAYSKH